MYTRSSIFRGGPPRGPDMLWSITTFSSEATSRTDPTSADPTHVWSGMFVRPSRNVV